MNFLRLIFLYLYYQQGFLQSYQQLTSCLQNYTQPVDYFCKMIILLLILLLFLFTTALFITAKILIFCSFLVDKSFFLFTIMFKSVL